MHVCAYINGVYKYIVGQSHRQNRDRKKRDGQYKTLMGRYVKTHAYTLVFPDRECVALSDALELLFATHKKTMGMITDVGVGHPSAFVGSTWVSTMRLVVAVFWVCP